MSRIAAYGGWKSIPDQWLEPFGDQYAFVILENPTDIRFEIFKSLGGQYLSNWREGALFSKTMELKWGLRHGKRHAVLICDEAEFSFPEGFSAPIQLDTYGSTHESALLWGQAETENDEIHFLEDRIPRDLIHPVLQIPGEKQRAILKYRTYRIQSHDRIMAGRIHRWCGVGLEQG